MNGDKIKSTITIRNTQGQPREGQNLHPKNFSPEYGIWQEAGPQQQTQKRERGTSSNLPVHWMSPPSPLVVET